MKSKINRDDLFKIIRWYYLNFKCVGVKLRDRVDATTGEFKIEALFNNSDDYRELTRDELEASLRTFFGMHGASLESFSIPADPDIPFFTGIVVEFNMIRNKKEHTI